MESEPAARMNELAKAHAALKAEDVLRLRLLTVEERSAVD